MSSIDRIISQNESILEKRLLKNTSFESISSPRSDFSIDCLKFSTVFTNAVILLCLSESKTAKSTTISGKLFSFLKKQKSNECTFNYWDNSSTEYKKIPYPDDLDDTFCALLAMYKFDKESIGGDELKKILEVLINQEVKTGGPYYTWLVDQNDIEWKDIDLAVNSNISNFLVEFGIELENISSFIDSSINNNSIKSRYYPTSTPVAYFISKSYRGQVKKKLVKSLESMYKKKSSTLLDKIIISSSLLRLNLFNHELITKTVEILLDEKIDTNKAFPFYRGVNPFHNGKRHYSGSESLTAAMVIEFLTLYKNTREAKNSGIGAKLVKLNKSIYTKVSQELIMAGGIISEHGNERLSILMKNPDMALITCVPYIIYSSIKKPIKIDDQILADISKATLFGWLAYDIYDDFFDKQAIPHQLSIANFSLRKLSAIFTSDYFSPQFHTFFHETMNIVDNANASEAIRPNIVVSRGSINLNDEIISVCKSAITNPENKSIGHILPVVAVYSLVGYSPQHIKTVKAINFFKNYLAARQIIDDMHDWEEDIRSGKINTVSCQIINEALIRGNRKTTLNYLRSLFWETTIIKSCRVAQRHINQAEKFNFPLLQILEPLKNAIDLTIKERQIALDFLK